MDDFDATIERLERGDIVERACVIALKYGQIDGAHHKDWVIDQMLRVLAGAEYERLIALYNTEGYEWYVGIAP